MSRARTIEFVLKEKIRGAAATPETIGLARFNEFNRQVEHFLRGSASHGTDAVGVTIRGGAYTLRATLPTALMTAIAPDLAALRRGDPLDAIDRRRADVVADWQRRARQGGDFSLTIKAGGRGQAIKIHGESELRFGEGAPWLRVEHAILGTVIDMGGAGRPNIHLRREGSEQILVVAADRAYLGGLEENLLYHRVRMRVEAEQHAVDGSLRGVRLLACEPFHPEVDEAALDRFAAAGRLAWQDVPDAAAWVRQIRGRA